MNEHLKSGGASFDVSDKVVKFVKHKDIEPVVVSRPFNCPALESRRLIEKHLVKLEQQPPELRSGVDLTTYSVKARPKRRFQFDVLWPAPVPVIQAGSRFIAQLVKRRLEFRDVARVAPAIFPQLRREIIIHSESRPRRKNVC